MSRVDLDRNREALARAQTQVADPNNKTDWALFAYEGKTNVVKLVETGDGGLEELVDELSSGKIQYAFCQIQDPNTGLPKNVFINWQGEGVPEIRKGSCANHVHDVSKFFKSAHLTINARTEDDVEEDVIKGKLAKASGSNYSVHKEQRRPEDDAPQGPVASVYQKTKAHAEIAKASRGKFWDEVSQEQSKQKQDEQKRRTEEYQRAERERKEEEAKSASEREKKESDRIRKIREQKAYEKQQEEGDKGAEKENWEKQQRDALRDEDERRQRSERARKERAAEARALVAQRPNDPKSPFDKKPPSQFDEPTSPTSKGPAPPRKLKHTFLQEDDTPVSPTRKQPIELPKGDSEPSPPTSPVRKVTPQPASSAPSKPPRAQEPDRPPAPPPARQTSPPPAPPAAPAAPAAPPAQTKNLMSANLPARPPSDDEEEDDQDWEVEDSGKPQAVVAPATKELEIYDDVGDSAEPLDIYDDTGAAGAAEPEQELYDDIKAQPEGDTQPGGDTGLCARALYDYQAAEENEITFDPGDIITNVETIDPGWWLGVAPDGAKGMFPANYVELIQ